MADVDMKPADDLKDEKTDDKSKDEEKDKKPPPTPLVEIKTNVALIERAVSTLEPRFTHRVLRSLTTLRKRLDDKVLQDAVVEVYTNVNSPARQALLVWIPEPPASEQTMDVDSTPSPSKHAQPEPVPECEIYLRLLILQHMLATPGGCPPAAMKLAHETVEKMQALNRRSMDPIAAKVWYAVERTYELCGELADARPLFLSAQRTASLRHDDETQASLINRLLRSYLHYSLYDQADKLISKTSFPVSAGNPQFARYHYFLGRIKPCNSTTLQHTRTCSKPSGVPPSEDRARVLPAVHKLSVVVELLMGDIPERSLFRHPVLEKALSGYFEIVKAVRMGSLSQFQNTLAKHAAQFEADKTYTLIARLRQNVIKTGIRRLSLSYSRISLRDICVKLHLDSEEDAEYIVGKAIRDGVIEGRIVHEKGWMECGGQKGGYGPEVSDVFARRIAYCLELHNQSVKAMRYPLNAHRKELAAAEGAREREKELAKEIQEGGDIDEDGPDLGEGF
ncbi:diphenol oxidase-A2 [Amylocystis lapponica]|nr:diphenol oxidase-A2 [Amylocystis lapponica]